MYLFCRDFSSFCFSLLDSLSISGRFMAVSWPGPCGPHQLENLLWATIMRTTGKIPGEIAVGSSWPQREMFQECSYLAPACVNKPSSSPQLERVIFSLSSSCGLELWARTRLIDACRREVWTFLKHLSLGSWWSDCNTPRVATPLSKPHHPQIWQLSGKKGSKPRSTQDTNVVRHRSVGRWIWATIPIKQLDQKMLFAKPESFWKICGQCFSLNTLTYKLSESCYSRDTRDTPGGSTRGPCKVRKPALNS